MRDRKAESSDGLAEEGRAGNDENLEGGRASGQIRHKRMSELNELMKDGELLDSGSNGGSASLGEQAPESSSSDFAGPEGSKKKVQDGQFTKTRSISALAGQSNQDKQSSGSAVAEHDSEPRLSKSKKKKDLNLPRRASKRLAGIEVDSMLELKPSTRARRVGSKQSDNSAGYSSQQPEKLDIDTVVEEEHVKTEENPDVLSESLAEFFADPCIAFAIKTLKDHSGDEEADNMSYTKQESNVLPPSGNVVKQQKQNFLVGTGEKSGSSVIEPPSGSSWQDPCIEFAIKTLTGAIPLEYDPRIEEYFQKQLGSSQQHKGGLLPKEIA